MLRVQQGFARLRAGRVAALTCHWHVIHYRSHRIPAYTISKIFPLPLAGGNIFGAPAGIRTLDTRLKRAVLYLLSYWGRYINFFRAPRESEESYRRGWDGGTRTHYIGVKVRCVTITLHPIISYEPRPAAPASIILYMGWDMGLEPTTPGTTIRCSANGANPTIINFWHAKRDSNPRPTA